MTNKLLYLNDHYRPDDNLSRMRRSESSHTRIASKVEFFNDSGERIWEPLHNKTVIAGSALTAMKLFNLDRNVLDFTPTYEQMFTGGLIEGGTGTTYPTRNILDDNGSIVGSVEDVLRQCSNNHLITLDPSVRKAVKRIKIGDHIRIKGYLVYVDGHHPSKKDFYWYSSTSRDDVGSTACEIILVKSVEWLD